jgi:hypothetical protein
MYNIVYIFVYIVYGYSHFLGRFAQLCLVKADISIVASNYNVLCKETVQLGLQRWMGSGTALYLF